MSEKEKIRQLCKPFLYEQYEKIDLNSLAAYTIHLLKNNNIYLNFENVAVALFLMFPKKFCMVGYEEFPDTNRINRTVNLQLRPKYQNLAFGDSKTGYSLTEKGKVVAEQTKRILESDERGLKLKKSEIKNTEYERTTNPKIEIEKRILSSSLYKKYCKNKNSEIEKVEIYEFLNASPYTSKDAIRSYYNYLKNLCKNSENMEALEFIIWLGKKASTIISGGKND